MRHIKAHTSDSFCFSISHAFAFSLPDFNDSCCVQLLLRKLGLGLKTTVHDKSRGLIAQSQQFWRSIGETARGERRHEHRWDVYCFFFRCDTICLRGFTRCNLFKHLSTLFGAFFFNGNNKNALSVPAILQLPQNNVWQLWRNTWILLFNLHFNINIKKTIYILRSNENEKNEIVHFRLVN